MFPNNDEIMYRYSRMHGKEIRNEVEAARDEQVRSHILRRRLKVLAGAAVVAAVSAVTLAAVTLALGWWVI